MKKRPDRFIRRVCVLAGSCLLIIAAMLPLLWQWGIRSAEQKMDDYAAAIRALIPEPESAVPEARRDNTMSVLSLDGTDFLGMLEMPRYESALPVCAEWGQPSKYPCRFSGSIYDGTMQLGGTSQKGQYDFYREISVGDSLFFTDMEGNRYAYTVAELRYEKHADQDALQRRDAALKLFIKNVYGFEYIVIFCDAVR